MVTREVLNDLRDYFSLKERFRNSTEDFLEFNDEKLETLGIKSLDLNTLKFIRNLLDAEPLVFKSKEEFDAFTSHSEYERSEKFPGMCWALLIDENISTETNKSK